MGWFGRALFYNVVLAAVMHAVRPMVAYRAVEVGGGALEVGLIAAAFGLVGFVLAVPAGRLTDRVGEQRLMIVGMSVIGATAALLICADSIATLVMAMIVLGIGQIFALIAMQTLIANGGGDKGRDARFGGQTVAASLGQLLGPVGVGMLAAALSSDTLAMAVFLSAAGVASLGVVAAILLAVQPPSTHARHEASVELGDGAGGSAVIQVLRMPDMPNALTASFAILCAVDILITYLPAYAASIGISVGTAAMLLAVRGAASLLSRLLMLPMLRLAGRRRLLVWCTLAPAVALATLPLAGSTLPILVALMVVIGFGLGLGQPLTLSWVAGRAPTSLRATAIGVRVGMNRLGQFAVPIGIGAIAGAASLSLAFPSVAVLLLGATLAVHIGGACASAVDSDATVARS